MASVHQRLWVARLAVVVGIWGVAVWAQAGRETDEFSFAEGLFVHKDYLSAIEEFRAFVATFPDSKHAALASYRIGECHMRLEDMEAAAAAFGKALAAYPDAKEAPLGAYNLARARLRLKDSDKALAAFRQALTGGKHKVREEALVGVGECLIDLGRFDEAAETYATLLKEFPATKHRGDALFSLGWTQAKLDRHKEATESFSTLIRDLPDYPNTAKAKLALSDAYAATGDYEKSAGVLETLKGRGDLTQDVLLRRAWNLFRSGDKKAAAAEFGAFAKAFPKASQAPSACFNAGIACFDIKQFDEAARHFERVLRDFPEARESLEARYWRGLSLFNLGDAAGAVTMLAPLAGNPGDLSATKRDMLACIHAQALARTGKHGVAAAALREFLKQSPDSELVPTASYALAHSLEQTGDLGGAAQVLVTLLAKLPASQLRNDALFAVGEYLYRLKEFAQAVPYLEEYVKAAGKPPKGVYRLAWAYFDLGRFNGSLPRFKELGDFTSPFQNEALFMTGRSAEKLGQVPAAVAAYQRLAALPAADEFVEKAMLHLAFLVDGKQADANLSDYKKRFTGGQYTSQIQLKLAETRFAAGDTAGAETVYRELLEADVPAATRVAARYGLGWCLLKQGKLDEADACFAETATAEEASAVMRTDASLQRGEIAYRREKFAAAQPFFEQVKGDSVRGERAAYMLGWCMRRLGKADAEERWFREAVTRYPKGRFRADSVLRLGELLNRKQTYGEAAKLLASVLQEGVPPELTEDVLHTYCDSLVGLRDWNVLLEYSKELQEKFPDSNRAFLVTFRLGVAHQELGLMEKAEEFFRTTVEATDTVEAARAQFNIGSIYFSRDKFVEAAKSFLRVEMLYDYEDLAPKSLFYAVDAFRRAGESRRAELYERKLRETYPDSEWAKKSRRQESK